MRSLKGRVAVITGASSGIGRETALLLARSGACVVVAARRKRLIQDLAARINVDLAGAQCLAVPTDVANPADLERLVGATLEHFGRIDIWVNNAGFGQVAMLENTTPAEFERIWQVNTMAVFHACQVVLPQMRRQGRGVIINVSSLAGRYALPLNGAYAATKHAVNALGQALGMELAGTGIRVCTVMPGLTDTGFFEAMVDKAPHTNGPIVRATPAERVAEAIVRCAVRPRDTVVLAPGGRLLFAMAEVFPVIYRTVARAYLRSRGGPGQGHPGHESQQ